MSPRKKKEAPLTISLVPTWAGIFHIYVEVMRSPQADGKARAKAFGELGRMAKAADLYNETAPALKLEPLARRLLEMVDGLEKAARTARTPDLGLVGKPGFDALMEDFREVLVRLHERRGKS